MVNAQIKYNITYIIIYIFKQGTMLRLLLSKSLGSSFCLNNRLNRIYDITYQMKDVTMMRGMETEKPYFYLEKQKIQLPNTDLIFELNQNLPKNESQLQFLDSDLNLYHPTTPLSVVCSQVFFVKRQGNIYCILNNLPILSLNVHEQFNVAQCSKVVQAICRDSIHDLPQNQKQTISGTAIHNLMVTNLLRHGMTFKIDKIRWKQILKVVNREITLFENQIKQLEFEIKRKANNRLKNYTTFLVLQYMVMHYYIYQHLSWDIMEPITVIFANVDLFVGYLFFVMRGRQWSLGEMHGSYIDQRKYTNLKNNGINVQKYDQLLRIREFINFRMTLLSKNPYDLMEMLEKPLKLLDTR